MPGGSVGPLRASLGTIRQDFSTHVETARWDPPRCLDPGKAARAWIGSW